MFLLKIDITTAFSAFTPKVIKFLNILVIHHVSLGSKFDFSGYVSHKTGFKKRTVNVIFLEDKTENFYSNPWFVY